MWWLSCERVRPPFRARSCICKQISRIDLPCHAIEAGARAQAGLPGMLAIDSARVEVLADVWHEWHGIPGTPTPCGPPYINGTCACRSSPWVGSRVAG